jgi:ABC-type multidrug transport system fused ATPase/permease subunit
MAFINIVRFPMNLLAQAMKLLYDSNVSTVRLEKFLFLDTLPETPESAGDKILGVGSVELRNCSFVWDGGSAASDDSAFALQDVSLTIGPTELVAVVGAVGSGKSALISSILGELSQVKGEPAVVGGSKAYMAQTPWIQGLTLKSNVLFGRTFTDANADGSFNAALNAACLLPDLEVLPASAEVCFSRLLL